MTQNQAMQAGFTQRAQQWHQHSLARIGCIRRGSPRGAGIEQQGVPSGSNHHRSTLPHVGSQQLEFAAGRAIRSRQQQRQA